ncbi:MAG: divalent-cation tolerance protein CutA [Chitinispirillaceae bacterium]
MEFVFAYITTKDNAQALSIGKALVQERLAACINVLDPMTSVYWWEGKLTENRETVLVAKAIKENFPALVERVKQLHSYECPCVVALPITDGSREYLQWIEQESRGGTFPPPPVP